MCKNESYQTNNGVFISRGNFKTIIKMRFDMFALALRTHFAVCLYSSIRSLRHCDTSHCAFRASFEITSPESQNARSSQLMCGITFRSDSEDACFMQAKRHVKGRDCRIEKSQVIQQHVRVRIIHHGIRLLFRPDIERSAIRRHFA